jgi:CRP-like cAMP-binding protein
MPSKTGKPSRAAVWILPMSVWRSLAAVSVTRNLRPKEVLFHAGDAGDGCYVVREGAVKATILSRDGQERLLAVFGPGSMIGEMSLVDDEPRSATVSAIRDCRLVHLRKQAFFSIADANPAIYRHAMRLLAQRLRGTNESVLAQGSKSAAGRVALAFASLAGGLGETAGTGRIVLGHRITQTDVANMAGVARENASRVINDMLRSGILARQKGHYVIERPDKLQELTEI